MKIALNLQSDFNLENFLLVQSVKFTPFQMENTFSVFRLSNIKKLYFIIKILHPWNVWDFGFLSQGVAPIPGWPITHYIAQAGFEL